MCLDPDGDEGQSSRGSSGARIGHDRYAPSIKLDRHPLLKKSQSNSEISNSGAELLEALRRRPRNRAPPPPPGTKKDKGQGAANAPPVSGSGHKRSRSDLSGHSPEPPRLSGGQSPNVARVAPTRPVGRLSPGQKRGMPPRPPYQRSPESSRCEVKDQSTPKEAANVKPKRQAPPPPAARRGVGEGGVFPEYASVNKQRVRGDQVRGCGEGCGHTYQPLFPTSTVIYWCSPEEVRQPCARKYSGSTSPPLNLSFFVAFGGVIT